MTDKRGLKLVGYIRKHDDGGDAGSDRGGNDQHLLIVARGINMSRGSTYDVLGSLFMRPEASAQRPAH
jgi:hypothetical protein